MRFIKKNIALILLALIIAGGGAYLLISKNSDNWKTYSNSKYGFSISYPLNFVVTPDERGGDYLGLAIDSPDGTLYSYVAAWIQPDPLSTTFLKGPFSTSTGKIERQLDGLQGVETFGYTSEGHDYADTFNYQSSSGHLYELGLYEVLEQRISSADDPDSRGALDSTTYYRIRDSFKVTNIN